MAEKFEDFIKKITKIEESGIFLLRAELLSHVVNEQAVMPIMTKINQVVSHDKTIGFSFKTPEFRFEHMFSDLVHLTTHYEINGKLSPAISRVGLRVIVHNGYHYLEHY